MPGFFKSVVIATTVAAGTVGSVAAIGMGFDVSFKGAADPAINPGPSVVRMAPISVHIGGWTLKKKKNEDKTLTVSIAIDVPDSDARDAVCRLMPRLVSAVNGEVSRNVLYQATWKEALTGSLGQRLTVRFNRALGRTLINGVRLQAHASETEAPPATCTDAV